MAPFGDARAGGPAAKRKVHWRCRQVSSAVFQERPDAHPVTPLGNAGVSVVGTSMGSQVVAWAASTTAHPSRQRARRLKSSGSDSAASAQPITAIASISMRLRGSTRRFTSTIVDAGYGGEKKRRRTSWI